MRSVNATPADADRVERAIDLARQLLASAEQDWTHAERRRRRQLSRLLDDRSAFDLTLAITDAVLRVPTDARAARLFAKEVRRHGAGHGFGLIDRALLQVGAVAVPLAPRLGMPLVR